MAPASPTAVADTFETQADDDLTFRIRLFLQMHLPATVRRIEIGATDGVVTVAGCTRTFYERQLALACIQRVAGVRQVVDLLDVMEEARSHRGPGGILERRCFHE